MGATLPPVTPFMPQHAPLADPPYRLLANASLAERSTFGVPARAARLVELHDAAALPEVLARPECRGELLVLGGGSNILFTRDFNGTVLQLANRGIEVLDETLGLARVRVAAGENWDSFVRWSLAAGYAGLENLILIPGTVGAAPMQNIGAYGVELSEFVAVVEAWDRRAGAFVRLDRTDCGFAYRDSRFKRERDRYIITAVELDLPREREVRIDYAGVRQELEASGIYIPSHAQVAAAVEGLRRRKLPDPAKLGNAGSFFKNPVVEAARAEALCSAHSGLPVYPAGEGRIKLSAAWLIEQCGFKGLRAGGAGVSEKHALVLVNHGGATGAEILALAERIRDTVKARFGISLEPEPLVI